MPSPAKLEEGFIVSMRINSKGNNFNNRVMLSLFIIICNLNMVFHKHYQTASSIVVELIGAASFLLHQSMLQSIRDSWQKKRTSGRIFVNAKFIDQYFESTTYF